MDRVGYVALCYALSVAAILSCAVYAVVYGAWFQRRRQKITDTEGFVTARATQGMGRIGWSFFCGAVGAWALVTPANFASFAGIVGVCAYAAATGIPILMIALFGDRIMAGMPHVFSLSDFVGWRFGPIAKTIVALIALFNMCIVLLAEYTTIGSIFSDFVGTIPWPVIVVVGLATMAYTSYGGLLVSIATDQVQGVASAALMVAAAVYIGVVHRQPIPKPLPEALGATATGWESIFTLGASLTASYLFSEAMWQRVWASVDKPTLYGGAAIGVVLTTSLIFLTGFGGWLAIAKGLVTPDTNPNLYFFQLFGTGYVSSAMGVVLVLLAALMNEGAIDSLQNGIASSLGGHFFKHAPLWCNRVGVIALNVPLMVLAITRGYNVLSLFLVTNLLCCCAAVPIALGLLRRPNAFFTESGCVFGIASGVLALTALGIGTKWDPSNVGASFAAGADWAWFSNAYHWSAFLTAILASTAGDLMWCTAAAGLRRAGVRGPGISGLLMAVPGMGYVTATPGWSREAQPKGWDDLPAAGAPLVGAAPSKDVELAP
ncbi:MAG: hypothetical protein J3K34DRAFT_517076 [Monoraphidium minutum]|nr:MAG: hypothetical protein J3K34DRAFT_517076 [Monoraphidium minutum]